MIFVSVGTQLPFDRLVQAVDEWVGENPAAKAFAQIGDGAYQPRHMPWDKFLSLEVFRERLFAAGLVVSHAGIGNLLLALEAQKPIVMMPRRAALGEHRNDHQLATAKRLGELPGITIVDDAAALRIVLGAAKWPEPGTLRPYASPELVDAIREFIERA